MSSQSNEPKAFSVLRYVLAAAMLVGMFGVPAAWYAGLGEKRERLQDLPDCGATVNKDCLELRAGTLDGASTRKARKAGKYTFESEDGERDGIKLTRRAFAGGAEVEGIYHDGDLIGVEAAGERRWGKPSLLGLPALSHLGFSALFLLLAIASGFAIHVLNLKDPGGQAAREAKAQAAKEKLNRRFG